MLSNPIAVTIPNAVKLTGLSRSKLYELIQAGQLPVRKCGSRTLVRHEDLKQFIDGLPPVPAKGGEHA